MSQQKVDKYKEKKANREKIMKKEKRIRRVEFIVIIAVIAAAVVWFGVSVYNNSKAQEQTGTVYLDSKDVVDYMNDPEAYVKAQESGEDTGTEAAEDEAVEVVETGAEGEDAVEVVTDEEAAPEGE